MLLSNYDKGILSHGVTKGKNDEAEKVVSLHEPTTSILQRGKRAKPTEFGHMIKVQEGDEGFLRWVYLGAIACNASHIARRLVT